jgi:aminodeoxyfutalosine deaminase
MPTTYTARWLFPVAGPPLARGTLTVDGEYITHVSPHGVMKPDVDLGQVAIIPGLVNAHTHLDLSGARGQIPPTTADKFPDWLGAVIAYRRQTRMTLDDIHTGLAESLRYGTTCLGDISTDGASFPILAAAPVRAVVYHEVLGLIPKRYEAMLERFQAWLASTADTPTVRRGISPHAPYSTASRVYEVARQLEPRLQIATHLAESPAEMMLLRTHSGPMRQFLDSILAWDPSGLMGWDSPLYIHELRDCPRGLIVHGNWLNGYLYADAIPSNLSLVVCPRTHAAFGHPLHPWPTFAAAGVRVAVGTDSLASNPDLDILAELRCLRRTNPDIPGEQLLRKGTLNGADALGFADITGSLEAGKSADFVAIPVPDVNTDDPHELLLGDDHGTRSVWFRGEKVV